MNNYSYSGYDDYTDLPKSAWDRFAGTKKPEPSAYRDYYEERSGNNFSQDDYDGSNRMKDLYALWRLSQLETPHYETRVPIGDTTIYGGLGDFDNVGYNQMYGVQQNIGPAYLGYERSHAGNKYFDEWQNKYKVGAGGRDGYIEYAQQRGESKPAHTVSGGVRIGKANVGGDYTKQGDYHEYNANIGGRIGKFDASLNYHNDSEGNKKIYAMLGRDI